MKMNKKYKIAAFVTAAAFFCSSTGYYAYTVFEKRHDKAVEKTDIVREISADVVPEDQREPTPEKNR